jgi:O-antigen/teichoic acid export membrane protein
LVDSAPPILAAPLRSVDEETAALARGGRTNFFGFLLRLVARLPFLYVAGRWYGADALGRFAFAVLVVEFAAQVATFGLKRGLAQLLSAADEAEHPHIVWDAMLIAISASFVIALILAMVPELMFPNSAISGADRLLPLIVAAVAGTEVALAALAYRYDVGATVRARAIVEPWTISLAAVGFAYYSIRDGLILSYVAAMLAAFVTALVPLLRSYGWPRDWRLSGSRLTAMVRDNWPLAGADAAEWGSRRLDMAVLGLFASPSVVGIYYVAQQVASLPQKLKGSFEPILGPVIARGVAEGRLGDVARQVAQVGFWVLTAQAAVALALGIPARAIMGLAGPGFVAGELCLILLLAAEVVASTAVTSEAALVYLAPRRNLMMSLLMIASQTLLSVAGCFIVWKMRADPIWYTVVVAGVLAATLGITSIAKTRFLSHLTKTRAHGWRPVLLWASAAAVVLGYGATQLPEWAELLFGAPAILAGFIWIVWTRGFGPEDRALLMSRREARVRG